MRFVLRLALSLAVVATELEAQQPGVLSNPRVSPVIPDFIAYERIVGDRGELMLRDLASGRDYSASQVVGAVTATARFGLSVRPELRAYAGQLDWRPVVDGDRSWYAYVESNSVGNTELKLNYVDRRGNRGPQPITVPNLRTEARFPRWSPDGRHIAFVGDSGSLMILYNAMGATGDMGGGPPQLLRSTGASVPALFPAWSPLGDFIAYGTDVTSRGAKNGAIEVLPLNKTTGRPEGNKVVVTSALTADNEYRPSWSPKASDYRLAFYSDQAGLANTRGLVAIGIVDLEMNQRTGQLFRGVMRQGLNRWIAEDVVPDDSRGPQWATVMVGSDEIPAIHYVRRDDSLVVKYAAVEPWMAQMNAESYELTISGSWNAASPKFVNVTPMNQFLRYVFTAVEGGGDVVRCYDATAKYLPSRLTPRVPTSPALCGARGAVLNIATGRPITTGSPSVRDQATASTTGAQRAAPTPTNPGEIPTGQQAFDASVTLINPQKNLGYAVFFPGLGQFSAGNKPKGTVLMIGGLASAGFAALGFTGMSAPLSEAKNLAAQARSKINNNQDASAEAAQFNSLKSTFDSKQSALTLGGGLYAVLWAYGAWDAFFGYRGTGRLTVTPIVAPDGRGGSAVGLSLPIGRSRAR